MLDIHAHLHDSAFDADRDEVVRRARAAGVEKIITIGTDIEESRRAIACAEKYEGVFASVGIHPNEIESPNANHQEILSELKEIALSSDKVVAIGECGLDYFVREGRGKRETADAPPAGGTTVVSEREKALQKELFLMQIDLAQELNLPLIIHCRPSTGTVDAYEDVFEILHNTKYKIQNTVLHCYMGDTEVTKKFLELPGVCFSFTGNITYSVKKSVAGTKDDLTEVVKMIPIDQMLAETDCPYLAPVPHRGERNEPANVALVASKIAEIKGISEEEVKRATALNAEKIFSLA